MWMDLALARRSGQELHNTYTITQSPEFGPLRRFFASTVTQLQRAFNDMPVPSGQPPSTDTPLLESIRAAVDYDDRSDEDTTSADSPADSCHRCDDYIATGRSGDRPTNSSTDSRESVAPLLRGRGPSGGAT